MDEGVEGGGVDGEDAFEGEAVGGREGGLQAGHGEGGGGVAGLGGEHEGDEGLETLVLWWDGDVRIDGVGALPGAGFFFSCVCV